jgi:ketosteroid isomerase-like protein
MSHRQLFAASLVLSAFCIASTVHAQSPVLASPDTKASRESLLRADRAMSASSVERGMSAALASVLAPDALFLYDGAPIVAGRANVISLLDEQPELRSMRVQWLPIVVVVSGDGLLGATYGVTTVASRSRPDSALRFGKYISTWRRVASGEWQLASHVDMGLTTEPAVLPTSISATLPATGSISNIPGASFAKADIDFARMASEKGAPLAFAAFAAADAATLPGTGEIVMGPAAIGARMAESPAATAKWEWHPLYADGSKAGDLGFTVGEATITPESPPGASPFHSKYLTVWRRQSDGSIRFIVDGGNSR